MKNIAKVYIGVDISKDELDISVYPTGESFKIPNDKPGIKKIIRFLTKHDVAQIACEATGGYEKLLAQLLQKSSYPLWIVDPRRIKGLLLLVVVRVKLIKMMRRKLLNSLLRIHPTLQ